MTRQDRHQHRARPSAFHRTLVLEQLPGRAQQDAQLPRRVAARLDFDRRDPYAVHLSFTSGRRREDWAIERELLRRSLDGVAGRGAVRIEPRDEPGTHRLLFSLGDRDDAQFAARRVDVSMFLAESYDLVPVGAERRHLDLELVTGLRLGGDAGELCQHCEAAGHAGVRPLSGWLGRTGYAWGRCRSCDWHLFDDGGQSLCAAEGGPCASGADVACSACMVLAPRAAVGPPTRIAPTAVRRPVWLWSTRGDGPPRRSPASRVSGELRYVTSDPLTAELQAHTPEGYGRSLLRFTRGMLELGTHVAPGQPIGDGQLRIGRDSVHEDLVRLELREHETLQLLVAGADVAAFLTECYRALPRECEAGWLDVDAALDVLLRRRGDPGDDRG